MANVPVDVWIFLIATAFTTCVGVFAWRHGNAASAALARAAFKPAQTPE